MAADPSLAVLGAGGTMGFPIARNLARAGLEVRAWNRTPDRAEPLRDDGARIAGSPAEAVAGAGLVLTMLADTDAVLDVMNGEHGALAALGGSGIWLQMSTIGEAGTERCARLAAEHGVLFVDTPVLGTRQPAEQGKLVVLASGPTEVRDTVQPVFDAIGQKTLWVGAAGAATRLKLAVNVWVVTVVEGGAEMIALAEGLGLDPQLIFEAIGGGPLDLPYLRMKGQAMMDRDFTPAFKLKLAAKDARLAAESARRHGMDLPLLDAIAERMTQGAEQHGNNDMSATYLASAARPAG
jgi:3-hydroxyisobutyrate dehydrogenase